MPDETERAIEKLLRAYAKRRGSQDPLKLHPATRRLFQAEVTRVFKNKAGQSTRVSPWRLSLYWGPKLAWSAGLFLVLALTTWSIISSHKTAERERLLARNDTSSRQTLPSSTAESAAPATAPSISLSDARLTESKRKVSRDDTDEVDVQSGSKSEIVSVPPAQQPAPEMLKKDAVNSGLSQLAVNAPSGKAAPMITYSSAASGVLAGHNSSSGPTRLLFEEPSKTAKRIEKEQLQPVLASFEWEQSGSDIRVIDRDGSIYAGSWQTIPRQLNRIEQRRSLSQPTQQLERAQASSSPELFFQVSGTNRSLQRLIVFSGRLSVLTNAAVTGISTNLFTDAAAQSLGAALVPPGRPQISGTAVIGGTQQIRINAVSAKP